MKPPRVTVLIPTYNWSSALRQSIPSVLRQTYADFELLVIGDGCSDDSAEVVASFGDPRVRWLNLDTNSGSQTGPNNAGLEAAQGEYIAYLGHDDLWHPSHLQSLVATLDSSTADLAHAITILYGLPGTGVRALTGLTPQDPDQTLRFVPPSSWMHRRDLIEKIGPWKDHRIIRWPQDYEFLHRAFALQQRFALTRQLSVFKFTAGWRPDVYKTKATDEQQALSLRMDAEPDFLQRELLDVIAAYTSGTALDVGAPSDAPEGELVNRTKAFKGVDVELMAEDRATTMRYVFDQVLPGLEWHDLEEHPEYGPVQWSGPGTKSTLHLPLANDQDLAITIRVTNVLVWDVLASLQLAVNDEPVAIVHRLEFDNVYLFEGRIPAATLAKSPGRSKLTFAVNRTLSPRDVDPSADDTRRLGLQFNWIAVEPSRE